MTLKLLWWAYERLIGHLPPGQAEQFRMRFDDLLGQIVEAAAEGAVRGMKER